MGTLSSVLHDKLTPGKPVYLFINPYTGLYVVRMTEASALLPGENVVTVGEVGQDYIRFETANGNDSFYVPLASICCSDRLIIEYPNWRIDLSSAGDPSGGDHYEPIGRLALKDGFVNIRKIYCGVGGLLTKSAKPKKRIRKPRK